MSFQKLHVRQAIEQHKPSNQMKIYSSIGCWQHKVCMIKPYILQKAPAGGKKGGKDKEKEKEPAKKTGQKSGQKSGGGLKVDKDGMGMKVVGPAPVTAPEASSIGKEYVKRILFSLCTSNNLFFISKYGILL